MSLGLYIGAGARSEKVLEVRKTCGDTCGEGGVEGIADRQRIIWLRPAAVDARRSCGDAKKETWNSIYIMSRPVF